MAVITFLYFVATQDVPFPLPKALWAGSGMRSTACVTIGCSLWDATAATLLTNAAIEVHEFLASLLLQHMVHCFLKHFH